MLDTAPSLHDILSGRYVLKREIGRGGAATVFLAHDIRHERLVAIKVLHPELSNALGAQRFLREIKLTASLQHPHILPIHDSGAADSLLYYVMPFIDGDSLRERLLTDGRLSVEDAVRIGREVAGALAYAHEHGIVHRDIKPENILFSGGHAVLGDFGIARAIDRAQEKVTAPGTITGTPAYMSPEQARARAFDGRSDVYSLACVLYEALAGVPPFVGHTPQALLQQRLTKAAPPLRDHRHDVPPPVATAIARAMAMSPDDRYPDARAFSAALSAALDDSGESAPARDRRQSGARAPWLWAAALALFVSGGAAISPVARDRIGVLAGRVDTTRYAVLPFSYVGGGASSEEQEPVAQSLYAEMREWQGLRMASDVGVLDALRHASGRSPADMQSVARSVRAGRLVWGRVWARHDSLRVRVGVYDALDGTALREVTISGLRDRLVARAGGMRGLVADLLREDGRHPIDPSTDVGTRSLAAWRAYEAARHALDAWRLPDARTALERAIDADQEFARAHVWLAQLEVWRDEPSSAWMPHLAVAGRGRATLSTRDALLADALQWVARGRLEAACGAYTRLRDADSLDAVAWLGLAYCQGMNRRVVRMRTATGWGFEGELNDAQQAYERAVSIAPASFGAFSFDRVARSIFVLEGERVRRGVGPDSLQYGAMPAVLGDTVAFVAYPLEELAGLSLQKLAPRNDLALTRTRDRLRGILSTLAQRLPDDPDMFEALALVLELRDEITGTPNGGYSALTALERARMVATDSIQRVRIGAADIRLHVKLADFSRAVAMGDSMLAASPRASGTHAAYLAGVAALLGREGDAVRYLRTSGASVSTGLAADPPLVEELSAALFMRSALGVCDDSVRVLRRRLERVLESYVAARRRPLARRDHLQRPIIFAGTCLGPASSLDVPPAGLPMVSVRQAVARGNLARARTMLDAAQALRVTQRPGRFALDFTLAEAEARAAIGDTTEAIRELDLTLTALPTVGPYLVYEPGMAAAVGRSMAYRAELAARTGDRGSAALWASRVLTLWAHADRSLAPTIARMTQLATQTS